MRESRTIVTESKLDRVTGWFCGNLLKHLITAGSGGTAPLRMLLYTLLMFEDTHIHTVHVRMWADPLFSWG